MHVHTLIAFFALAGAPVLAYHGQQTLCAHALSKDGSSISARGLAVALLDELAARSITTFTPLNTFALERRTMSAEERRTKQATVREMIADLFREGRPSARTQSGLS
ncbi:hypothetical protein Hypma_014523 [Hypsizygus marmoreus]|uniref:Uncharacterized protein n=1 Tax=Hypsizygus marmoreus TaxID=39966 RepID=A0A369J9V4_HYPMA|nr:hypothetical protein Hypma_014523 [Hypsizygus marmoreus]